MTQKRIEKENLTLSDIKQYAAGVSQAVDQLDDQDTWLVMSFTLRLLEPLDEMVDKMVKDLQEKHYDKDKDGNYIMRKAPVVDQHNNLLTEKVMENGKEVERQMFQEVKQYKSLVKYNEELEKLMQQTKTITWEHTIPYTKMVQFPAGLRTLQHKLLNRVILLDEVPAS